MPSTYFENLETIRLCGNQLTGSLGAYNFNGFPYLYELDLSSNNLTGTIPDDYSNFMSLRILDLSSNSLTGSLPYCSLANIPELSSLSVHSNALTGLLPASTDTFWTTLNVWQYSPGNSFSGNATTVCNITAPWVDSTYIIEFNMTFSSANGTDANDLGPTILSALSSYI
eukprot:scaffold682807_cov64-Prasinocladus_malaysianus.AAC.1